MGLTTSHGCFSGGYSVFAQWRRAVAASAGIVLDNMDGFGGDVDWPTFQAEPLVVLLNHSDADGSIPSAVCDVLANRLAALLPDIESIFRWPDQQLTQRFIDGLRRAAAAGEDVVFR